jgi:histidinol-phosphatase
MSKERQELMEAATEAARRAGEAALAYFGRGIPVDLKSDGTPVTQADRSAEQAARDWIAARFPADGILGEEHGALRDDVPRRWIIDPIDGTRSFVRGVPLWGSLVAVAEGDRVLAGAVCFPALGERLAAAPGLGCWWNGARCRVSDVADLGRATALVSDAAGVPHPEGRRRLAALAAVTRSWGDCYGYLLVATGRAEVMVDPVVSVWDVAPMVPIIEEAGGVFTDWDGEPGFSGGSAIATNAALAEAARRHLGCPVPGAIPS